MVLEHHLDLRIYIQNKFQFSMKIKIDSKNRIFYMDPQYDLLNYFLNLKRSVWRSFLYIITLIFMTSRKR